MTRELKGLGLGLLAGLFVVGASYGVAAVATHEQSTKKPHQETSALPAPGTVVASSQLVASGRSLYLQVCANCHGQQAQGQIGPSLHHLGDPDATVYRNIANGFTGQMPAFKDKINDGQIKTLVAYVQSLE